MNEADRFLKERQEKQGSQTFREVQRPSVTTGGTYVEKYPVTTAPVSSDLSGKPSVFKVLVGIVVNIVLFLSALIFAGLYETSMGFSFVNAIVPWMTFAGYFITRSMLGNHLLTRVVRLFDFVWLIFLAMAILGGSDMLAREVGEKGGDIRQIRMSMLSLPILSLVAAFVSLIFVSPSQNK